MEAETGAIRVLLVTDESAFAETAATYLGREVEGLVVQTAASVDDGLNRLDAGGGYDCVVSDFDMPGRDGLDFLRAVRERQPELPFILCTANGSAEVADEPISAGVTDYVRKGSDTDRLDVLAERVQTLVRRRSTERAAADLERVNTVVRDVNQALVRASSHAEIERRVCEILSDADPYVFAWVGAPVGGVVEPRAWHGVEEGYLDEITVTADTRATGRGPVGRAIRTGDVAVAQNVQTDPQFDPWREQAVERGYRAVAAVPLKYGDENYGALAVYADRPNAFDADERALLKDVGANIAHAIDAALVRDRLHESIEKYRSLVETAPDAIIATDTNGTIQIWNPAAERMFGWSSEEVEGRRKVAETIVPDAKHDEYGERFQRLLDGDPYQRFETQRVRRDGTVLDVRLSSALLRNPEGDVAGVMAIVEDVTESKSRERMLRRFEMAVEESGHAIYMTDAGGRIEFVNDAFESITGYSAEEAIGETPRILKSDRTEDEYYQRLWETLFAGDIWHEEIVNRRKSGEEYYADQTIAPITNDGDVEGFVAIQLDTTELHEYKTRLERQNERLDAFVRVVTHDLRNPLNVASGTLEYVEDESNGEPVETIATALDRMAAIIDETLILAREGRTIGETGPVEFADVVTSCWRSVDTDRAEVVLADGVESATVDADRGRLSHLFENLFRNAVQHAGPSVVIRVGLLDSNDGFYVEDDGDGIPDGERDDVFDLGYSTRPEGTGYGLNIVEEIARAHGWKVAASESDAGGARFEFTGVHIE